jgi:hypothetical protein
VEAANAFLREHYIGEFNRRFLHHRRVRWADRSAGPTHGLRGRGASEGGRNGRQVCHCCGMQPAHQLNGRLSESRFTSIWKCELLHLG